MPKYEARFTTTVECHVVVTAKSKEEAKEKAWDKFIKFSDEYTEDYVWSGHGDPELVDIGRMDEPKLKLKKKAKAT